jgi:hypothetical protein
MTHVSTCSPAPQKAPAGSRQSSTRAKIGCVSALAPMLPLHHIIKQTCAAAVLPRVAGGPGFDLMLCRSQSVITLFERDGRLTGSIHEAKQYPRVWRRTIHTPLGNKMYANACFPIIEPPGYDGGRG